MTDTPLEVKLIRQQQAALAQQAAPVAVPDDIRAQIEGLFNACMFKEHCCRAIAAPTPPAQQPVAWISVEEPFHGTAGIEAGEWDIQCDGKAIDELAAANSPGRIPLYAAPPAQQSQAEWPSLLDACEEALAWIEGRTKGLAIDAKDTLRIAIAKVQSNTAPPAPEQVEPQECGCCGQTGPCDPDCDCVVTVPRELAERISIADSQGDGPALHEAIDELRALLRGDV